MKSIIYKNYKEFVEDRVNIIILTLPLLMYIIYSLATKSFDTESIFEKIVVFPMFYLFILAPKSFAQEKDNHTFETLITMPIGFEKVLFGTFLYLFIAVSLPAVIYLIVSTIFILVFNIENINMIFTMGLRFILASITLATMTFASIIVSLKSKSLIDCGMKIPFLLVPYLIPYTVIISVDTNDEIVLLGLYSLYLIINIIIILVTYMRIKKVFHKPTLLMLYGKGES